MNIESGIKYTVNTVVTDNDTAIKIGSGLLNVYATPTMIALMERTAKESVNSYLENGFTTVGIEVNIRHTRASKVGASIKCMVCLDKVEGKKLYFTVEAFEKKGSVCLKIGEGTHVRYIVNSEEFMKKLD